MTGDRRTSGNFVPLRPAPSPDSDGNSKDRPEPQGPTRVPLPEHTPPKRKVIAVACDNCRARRSRCGGQRPRCHLCAARGENCVYEAQEGESVNSALKRKLHNLEVENAQYKELYQLLKTKPDTESAEILRRIRAANDPRDVVAFLKEAELLLPSSSGGSDGPSSSGQEGLRVSET